MTIRCPAWRSRRIWPSTCSMETIFCSAYGRGDAVRQFGEDFLRESGTTPSRSTSRPPAVLAISMAVG